MYRVTYPTFFGGSKTVEFNADSVSSNMGGSLFLHRKTGRKIAEAPPFEGEKEETETVFVFAPGCWQTAEKR